MKVPLHYSGEENSHAVKFEQCLVNHVVTEIAVSCLPADLPEFISVDLSGLTKGKSLHLNDVKLPKGVTAVTRGKSNPVLVAVVATAEEVAEAPAADAAAAVAAKPAAGGKAPAKADAKAPAAKADAKPAAKPAAKK